MQQTKVVVTRYGGPEVITVAEQECPAPMPGEVRVKVLAAGVSLPDVLAREGFHPETPRVPYTPGWDLVGIVDQIGEGVCADRLSSAGFSKCLLVGRITISVNGMTEPSRAPATTPRSRPGAIAAQF